LSFLILLQLFPIDVKFLQAEPSTRVISSRDLEKFRNHRRAIEDLFSLFELSKSQITANMKDRVIKADHYIQYILKIFMQSNKEQSPDVKSKQQVFGPSDSRFFSIGNIRNKNIAIYRKY